MLGEINIEAARKTEQRGKEKGQQGNTRAGQ
jgi:hypothetical protein